MRYRVIFYDRSGQVELRCDVESDVELSGEVEVIEQFPGWREEPEPIPCVTLFESPATTE